jgi:hypothetical protein
MRLRAVASGAPYLWVEYISGFFAVRLRRRLATSLRRLTTDTHVRRTTLDGNARSQCCLCRTRVPAMSAKSVILADRT